MTPKFTILQQVLAQADYFALSTLIAGIFSALFGGDDDDEVIEAHEYILDALSDSDRVEVIEAITNKNLRDQLTAEQANALREEIEILKMGKSRN